MVSQPSPHDQFRLFIGWRLTKSTKVLFPTKESTIDTLGIPNMPSGQLPPMFSSNHQSALRHKEFRWTGPNGPKGTLDQWWAQSLRVPFTRHMNSLVHYGFEYPRYTPEEKTFMMTLHPLFN